MVQNTPNLGLPYVEGSDTLVSYPLTMEDLSTKLDALLYTPYGTASGPVISSIPGGTTTKLTVTTSTLDLGGVVPAGGNLTIPGPGIWLIILNAKLTSSATNTHQVAMVRDGGITLVTNRITNSSSAVVSETWYNLSAIDKWTAPGSVWANCLINTAAGGTGQIMYISALKVAKV